MDGRYRMLADDKARAEHEHRNRLNHSADEIAEARKQLEDLKFMLADKSRGNCELTEEAARAARLLDEKYFEAGRLRDEAVAKGDLCADLRAQVGQVEREIEAVKVQRAEMFRELAHLKDSSDQKAREACAQADQLKGLDLEISRTQARIDDLQRLLDVRTNDLRAKHLALEDTERELARMQDLNAKLTAENANLTRDNDHTAAENYDMRKGVDFQNGRNAEMAVQIRDTEIRLKEREDGIFVTRKDIDG